MASTETKVKARIAVFPKGYMDELTDGRISLMEWIEMAGTLEADGLELYPTFLLELGTDYLFTVRQEAERQGLQIPMMCSSPDFTHPDPDYRRIEIEKMKKMIDAMAVLGPADFRSCRVLSGQGRPGISREDGIRWTVDCIRELLPYAEKHSVHLVMENHYKDGYWQYPEFAQASDIYLEIIGQLSSPWFGVNYDPSNALVAGEDPLELLAIVKNRVITMHASDRYLREGHSLEAHKSYSLPGYSAALAHGVIGKGMNDYDEIFRHLKSIQFRNWISIEDGVNGMDEMRESVRFLKRKTKEYLS
ncbi:MAG: xylose isomerase-like barrel protein [Paenibacillus sp.]|jgi:sugar phosphate isomerase/epimerase|nr:xylose isomerase-like barrel protein [Paenibacillus sp.]